MFQLYRAVALTTRDYPVGYAIDPLMLYQYFGQIGNECSAFAALKWKIYDGRGDKLTALIMLQQQRISRDFELISFFVIRTIPYFYNLEYRFRNGTQVSFEAHRIRVEELISDIKAYLQVQSKKLYHMGIRSKVSH